MRENCSDFARIFLDDLPLMDVRAPIEFSKGAFPGVRNLPLMNDAEREAVGTCYKQRGQAAAIELGHRLVSGTLKEDRVQAWHAFAQANPQGYLYCFRGGLRSQVSQQWLAEAGIEYPRVIGGYKALRNYLINTIDLAGAECDMVLLGGLTGSGKTEVLNQLPNGLDLEGLANHRGSSFGRHATPQPGQIDFENALAVDILKKRARGLQQFVIEDEARAVGSLAIPVEFYRRMQGQSLVWLQDPVESRIERILQDYVTDLCAEFVDQRGVEQGWLAFAERLRTSMAAISKRLGGERYQRLAAALEEALAEQGRTGNVDLHRQWIAVLLNEYYDPMYAYQRDSKQPRIEFAGERAAVLEYLLHRRSRRT
jgi:tRNA 2-selenouridine synthase